MSGGSADARPAADDDADVPGQWFVGGHSLQLGLFEQPVLDVEGFLLRKGDVAADGLGTTHDFDGTVVELGGDARLGLVLAPRDHADTGDEHDGRVGLPHGGRVVVLAGFVVRGVVLDVLLDGGLDHALQLVEVA